MPRPKVDPLPSDLNQCARGWVTPSEAGDRVGVKAATIRKWCREGHIVAKRRNPTGAPNAGDWMIPIASLRLLEHRLGLHVPCAT